MSRRKKLPKILTEEEVKRFFETFNTRYPTGRRDKFFCEFILATGLRLSEAINLKWEHINLMSGRLEVVEGKGAKDRNVYANEKILEKLKDWKEAQIAKSEQVAYVFTTLTENKLAGPNVRKKIYKQAEKAGIKKKVSPHTFRHMFATNLYKETKNIRLVQKALGHSKLSTTMIYTHIVDEELEAAMKNMTIRI